MSGRHSSGRGGAAGESEREPSNAADPRWIGDRYEVIEALGQGGMAQVYRVRDAVSGKELALKQLFVQVDPQRTAQVAALFEREFHTLAQLSHPRVIEVYDYGLDKQSSYYTMELLDGGDLRERAPLPYRQACQLLYDVCSSLALLHARRLIHRDISPRNIRCTEDGRAKLIDFGAMVPMGAGGAQLVGTPAFVAPEVVHGSALDARTDLYSLGATLYFALTGRLAYAASSFAQLFEVWAGDPAPPSRIAPDIPEALDRLVLSLLSLEPARRPRSAFEVMQRLAALAGIEQHEAASVSLSYLATPVMVGRDEPLEIFRLRMCSALRRPAVGRCQLLIAAEPGLGRSRMLDACALEAKTLGATVVRARADAGNRAEFSVAQRLAEQVLLLCPQLARAAALSCGVLEILFDPAADGGWVTATGATAPRLRSLVAIEGRSALQDALARWLLAVADQQALWIAVDDVDRIDDASVALLAALAHRTERQLLLLTFTSEPPREREKVTAFGVLAEQCERLPLRPLDQPETERLLCSVFGDVQNIALLTTRIHAIAAGNPRECMALAQHLVDRRRIFYRGGAWTLPEQLTTAELPASEAETIAERVAQIGPLARRLAQIQALSLDDAFTREDYEFIATEETPADVDAAISALIAQQLLTSDGRVYRLAHRAAVAELRRTLESDTEQRCHRALAERYERSQRLGLPLVRELLLAGSPVAALDRLVALVPNVGKRVGSDGSLEMDVAQVSWTIERALAAAKAHQRSRREICELERWLLSLCVIGDDESHAKVGGSWLAQISRDTGLVDWRELAAVTDPNPRLMQALTRALERFKAAPEAERVYPPDEAIRMLVQYVVVSIVVGARTLDSAMMLSLPELLEPFVTLSPLLHAMWQNALATRETSCYRHYLRARTRWIAVFEKLDAIGGVEDRDVNAIRYGVAFGVGLCEASMGLESALRWAALLDRDPAQQVTAMYLRKVMCLQRGDLEGAEQFRKQAEVLAITANSRQLFTNLMSLEVIVHAAAWDLTGVQQIAARVESLAERHHGWRAYRHLARAFFERLRGDLEAAGAEFRACLALSTPDPADPTRTTSAWSPALSGYAESLIALGRTAEAKQLAQAGFELCRERDMLATTHDIPRALALAEAKSGAFDRAVALLDTTIGQQLALGVTGLQLGASYEARARVAIWAGDQATVEHYARLVAEQFQHGRGSTLGARYEYLMQEARRSGMQLLPQWSAFETEILGGTEIGQRLLTASAVADAMHRASDPKTRAEQALRLLCESRGCKAGYLYLVRDGRLELVATRELAAPDDKLCQILSDFWTRQIADNDMDTTGQIDASELAARRSLAWTDLQGASFQPVLITSPGAGGPVHAGVAMLSLAGIRAQHVDARIASEVGTHLVRAGDTPGVRTS